MSKKRVRDYTLGEILDLCEEQKKCESCFFYYKKGEYCILQDIGLSNMKEKVRKFEKDQNSGVQISQILEKILQVIRPV